MTASDVRPVAVLYQATPPPLIDGIRKPMKPGGYSDSGADIAYVLRTLDVPVVTPVPDPRARDDAAWVFPDTPEGIDAARSAGAEVLWANTVVFADHPLEAVLDEVAVVGQHPTTVHRFDDKWQTNELLRSHGLPVAAALLVSASGGNGVAALDGLDDGALAERGIEFPAIVKPIRGRGSQGVVRVDDLAALREVTRSLLSESVDVDGTSYPVYGDALIVEEYLPGTEVTITVLPPGTYDIDREDRVYEHHWSLPPVERSNHVDGITPYNGVVAVTANSVAVAEPDRAQSRLMEQCSAAAAIVGARAPIRIDCRARDGEYQLFDLNMKPNMTGAGRPGREDQDSLSCMAARLIGWSYGDLLRNMLTQAWTAGSTTTDQVERLPT